MRVSSLWDVDFMGIYIPGKLIAISEKMNFTAAVANLAVAFWETDLRVLTVAGIIAIVSSATVMRKSSY
jgi:hypothetical protein